MIMKTLLVLVMLAWASPVLACGWFLMANPARGSDLPVTKWSPSAAFDTARDCEASAEKLYQRAKDEGLNWTPEFMRCIPADWVKPASHAPRP